MTETPTTNMVSGVGFLPLLPNMDFKGNLAENFKMYRQRLEIYLSANGLDDAKDKRKISILLNFIGENGIKIYNSFNLNASESHTFEHVLKKFEAYFEPKKSLTIARNEFFTVTQDEDRLEDYFQRVINLGIQCELGDLREGLTVGKIISGLDSKYNNLKTRLMSEDDSKLTLDYVMKYLLSAETSRKYIEEKTNSKDSDESSILYVNKKSIRNCRNCGTSHNINKCPAYGKECLKCKKLNHFSKVCRSAKKPNFYQKQVNVLEDPDKNKEDEAQGDFFVGYAGNEIIQDFTVNNIKIPIKMDTGAACNVIGSEVCKLINIKTSEILPCDKKVIQLDGKCVPVRGTCWLNIIHPNSKKYTVKFIIIEGNIPTLLGCRTCLTYNFISANTNLVNIHNVTVGKDTTFNLIKKLKNDFSELFSGGLGCIPGTVNIQLSSEAVPTVQAARRVPFALMPELRRELDHMEAIGVIEKVDKPTKWVNNIVPVRKTNGKLRICIDPRALNKYILQPKYQLPTLDEIKSRMKNAKVFALLDASNGFWMLNLNEESSDLCTFITPFGRYRFKRLPFGISSAPEEFSRIINQMFENVEGVIPYIDDICVYAQSVEELNDRLRKVLQIALKNCLKLNESKCKFFMSELLFVGHKFTEKGVSPDPGKVQAVVKMEHPKCKKDLERFLGMCNYLSRFIPNYSKLIEPLRILMKKDTVFTWDSNQEHAVERLKEALCKSPCLAFFNTNQEIVLSVDSSSTAMGAVVLQNGKPIAYASRALTSTEQRYCQLEKEMLAIYFGCHKMHQYTYGRKVHVETDHRPLESLFKKPLYKVPARLQRMMLAVQGYNLHVNYKPGKLLFIADTLSRSCADTVEPKIKQLHDNIICHVKLQRDCLPISNVQLKRIQIATASDEILKMVITYVKQGWPKNIKDVNKDLRNYWTFRDELGVLDGIVLKSNLIVIPESLRTEMMQNIHQGHAGLNTCKMRARSCIFWPELNNDLELFVKQCKPCMKYHINLQKEPLIHHSIEQIPWYKVGIDICTLNNKDYLVFMDYYTKFIEVCKLDNLTSDCVIVNCKSIFGRHGIPSFVVTDCGTQFTSEKFKEFAFYYKFEHIKSSPKHSQSNGLSESGVKIFKNILRKCNEDGSDPYLGLLNYRNTPKPYMPSPAQLLYSRNLNSLIPVPRSTLKPKLFYCDSKYYNHLNSVKKNYDKCAKELPQLKLHQEVYFKKTLDSNWQKGKIIKNCTEPRSYLVADSEGKIYRRNRKYILERVPDSSPDTKNNCRTTKVKNHNFAVDDIPDIVLDNSMCQPSAKYVLQEPSLEKIVCGSNMATQASPARSRERSRSLDSSTNNANLPTPSSRTSRGGLNEQCSNDKITRSGRVVKKPTRFKDFVDIG